MTQDKSVREQYEKERDEFIRKELAYGGLEYSTSGHIFEDLQKAADWSHSRSQLKIAELESDKKLWINRHSDLLKFKESLEQKLAQQEAIISVMEKALNHVAIPANKHFLTLACSNTVEVALSALSEMRKGL